MSTSLMDGLVVTALAIFSGVGLASLALVVTILIKLWRGV